MTKEEDDGARKQWYLQSYEYFVKYFEDKKCLEKDDIVVGIAMAYSWMPKVPRLLKTKKITKQEVKLVNELKNKEPDVKKSKN